MSLAAIEPRAEVLPPSPRGLPLPWWVKIGAKTVLARVLASYRGGGLGSARVANSGFQMRKPA
jgi:hypothetical protein